MTGEYRGGEALTPSISGDQKRQRDRGAAIRGGRQRDADMPRLKSKEKFGGRKFGAEARNFAQNPEKTPKNP